MSKLLLPGLGPLVMAGLLYLGAGLGLALYGLVRPRRHVDREARLSRRDLGLLAGITVCGGILGPVLMLFGLGRVSGLTGSLLLNLEAPFTMLLAVLLFREHMGRHPWSAALLIVGGGLLLSWRPGQLHADPWGILAIHGHACRGASTTTSLSACRFAIRWRWSSGRPSGRRSARSRSARRFAARCRRRGSRPELSHWAA